MAGLDNLNPFLNIIAGQVGIPTAIGYVTTTLTNAQMLALAAAPVTVVGAPGASKRTIFLGASLYLSAAAGAYTESDDNLAIRYVDGSGVIVSETIQTTGFIDQAATIHTSARPVVDAICTTAQSVNKALVLDNIGNGEFGGGNAATTLTITVYYVISTIP